MRLPTYLYIYFLSAALSSTVMISAGPGLRDTQAPRTFQTTKRSCDVDMVDMEPRHYGYP